MRRPYINLVFFSRPQWCEVYKERFVSPHWDGFVENKNTNLSTRAAQQLLQHFELNQVDSSSPASLPPHGRLLRWLGRYSFASIFTTAVLGPWPVIGSEWKESCPPAPHTECKFRASAHRTTGALSVQLSLCYHIMLPPALPFMSLPLFSAFACHIVLDILYSSCVFSLLNFNSTQSGPLMNSCDQ